MSEQDRYNNITKEDRKQNNDKRLIEEKLNFNKTQQYINSKIIVTNDK